MSILDYIFPQSYRCLICDNECIEGICDECKKTLPYISGNICELCGGRVLGDEKICIECQNKKFYFEKNYSVLDYAGIVRNLILKCKQEGKKYIASAFSSILFDKFVTLKEKFDIITTVPIHSARIKERGFNQTDVLAEDIASFTKKVRNDIIIRQRNTPRQAGLDKSNRIDNIANAFKVVNKQAIKGKTILVVDDIFTTGATINECARTLLKGGAKKVYAMCLCRTPIDYNNTIE